MNTLDKIKSIIGTSQIEHDNSPLLYDLSNLPNADKNRVFPIFEEMLSDKNTKNSLIHFIRLFKYDDIQWSSLIFVSKVFSSNQSYLKISRNDFLYEDFDYIAHSLFDKPYNDLIIIENLCSSWISSEHEGYRSANNILELLRSKIPVSKKELLLLSIYHHQKKSIQKTQWLKWNSLEVFVDDLSIDNLGDIDSLMNLKISGEWDNALTPELKNFCVDMGYPDIESFVLRYKISQVSLRELGIGLSNGEIDPFVVSQYLYSGLPVYELFNWSVLAVKGQDKQDVLSAISKLKSLYLGNKKENKLTRDILIYISYNPMSLDCLGNLSDFWQYFNDERSELIYALSEHHKKFSDWQYNQEFVIGLMNLSINSDWQGERNQDLSEFLEFAFDGGMDLLVNLRGESVFGFNHIVLRFSDNIYYIDMIRSIYDDNLFWDKRGLFNTLKSGFTVNEIKLLLQLVDFKSKPFDNMSESEISSLLRSYLDE